MYVKVVLLIFVFLIKIGLFFVLWFKIWIICEIFVLCLIIGLIFLLIVICDKLCVKLVKLLVVFGGFIILEKEVFDFVFLGLCNL